MTTIEWTDQTWNPVTGCSKVSPGCDHCYAEALATGRLKGKPGYPGLPWTAENAAENVVLRPERLDQPKRWRKPSMVFVNSMSDLFHPRVPPLFIGRMINVMADCPQHVFQVLTKRPKRMAQAMRAYYEITGQDPLPNVWLGTSIESREYVRRADELRKVPAAVRFISAESLLGPLVYDTDDGWSDGADEDEHPSLFLHHIDWLIVGGESGQDFRRVDAAWVRALRDWALTTETAFFFKQWGGIRPKSGGRELDGRTWDEMPGAVSVGCVGSKRGEA